MWVTYGVPEGKDKGGAGFTVLFRPSVQSRITAKKITHPKCFSFDLSDFFGNFFDNFFPNV
jgi:hypothetical protein